MTLHPVILSGGIGSRLWPLSRRLRPKQLATLFGDKTMLQATALRTAAIEDAAAPIVVCGAQYADEILEQLLAVDCLPARMIIEPVGRNTAPAIAAVAMTVEPDDLLLVLPADHVISDTDPFVSSIAKATRAAVAGMLVTFGISPGGPATEYGYIERGPTLGDNSEIHSIIRFIEKPTSELAQQYVASGAFYWNAGMFLMKAGTYLGELEAHRPAIAAAVRLAVDRADTSQDRRTLLEPDAFAACPAESIDYAIMERTTLGAVIGLEAGWSDIGSWAAIWELAAKDSEGNHIEGSAYLQDVSDSLIKVGERPVAIIGLADLVVVDTGDALLIAAKDRVQEVKAIIERMDKDGRPEV